MADEPKAGESEATASKSNAKSWVLFLVILDVLAIGGFVYLKFFESVNLANELSRNDRNLMRLHDRCEEVHVAATRIARESQQPVSELNELINRVARQSQIEQFLSYGKVNANNWKRSPIYQERFCQVQINNKPGFKQSDLINFLMAIEQQNSKVQIKSMNFGTRDPSKDSIKAPGDELWRPILMEVRVFTPTAKK